MVNDHRAARGRSAGTRPEAAGLADGLDRLREALLHRLLQIEALAAREAADPGVPDSERERVLREKLAALEASHARLNAEFRRREQEWADNLAQVEQDRKLLTEAWERLEREQAEGTGPAEPPATVNPLSQPARAAPAPATYNPGGDSVTTAILREFEALRGDIRRSAKSSSGR